MKTVAVVGGTGFLGRHVVEALRGAGWEVRALSRRTGFDALRPDPEALRGCEAAVNLAGIKREAGGQTFESIHVQLVERLAAAMRDAGVSRLIHVSVVVARPAPELPYHDTKWRGEEAVRASGLGWTILRPGVIYGEGDDLLSHLSLMIRTAPVFPIVGDGSAPMMPVDARDVAAAVVGALRSPDSSGRTYDVVSPDRLTLRDVVRRVADAMGSALMIVPTPAALMKPGVALMEKVMKHPLSTRAQLAMLREGLAGDPAPARLDLGVEPAPFTVERLRPFVALRRETPALPAAGLLFLVLMLVGGALGGLVRPWIGMTAAMGVALSGSLGFASVRRRLAPTLPRIAIGIAAGIALYGLTLAGITLLRAVWPAWEGHAISLSAWKGGYPIGILLATLPFIVAGEEFFWRGVVTRFAMERLGRWSGIAAGAAVFALAHVVAMNPLLVLAAFLCGLYWGWLYAATDSLVAPVVCHLLWDATILFVFPIF